ncbi:Pre-mRNA-splicing factor [Wickerhamomyces ciferrii]|uniref:Pre-mRNA-splicing factor n=1 Tax=Wickerhamomyces ciferrii (strain ATCC 14091 / BCRC 22168 / CBS 111 / JCM 3599 / NBRC 0793 / NRRL Y-1031 F-60-10) TaxID=1206466 RepID=K0KV70_WICCF|nr:Pre-mRNA-splicing factor [Wickerhamomyces ciferrii]CCH45329.1 Pre-mRNA-splicing factor [Wickerhamomyces ciferrii]
MNYEPLDSLPYIDQDITDQERQSVERLILDELKSTDISKIHSKVDELYPLPEPSSIVSNIKEEQFSDPDFTLGGIDLSKYSNLDDLESLQNSIVFTDLRNKSLKLANKFGKNQWLLGNDLHQYSNEQISEELQNKRRKINDINYERKQIQLEAKPVIDYLEQRWQQGIKSNVDIGVEVIKLQLEE